MSRQNFKKTLSSQEINQKNKDLQKQQQIKLKEQTLLKRRKIESDLTKIDFQNSSKPKDLVEILNKTTDKYQTKDTLKEIRKLLSTDEPPIDEFIELGLVQILKNILKNEKNHIELLYESLWCITSKIII